MIIKRQARAVAVMLKRKPKRLSVFYEFAGAVLISAGCGWQFTPAIGLISLGIFSLAAGFFIVDVGGPKR